VSGRSLLNPFSPYLHFLCLLKFAIRNAKCHRLAVSPRPHLVLLPAARCLLPVFLKFAIRNSQFEIISPCPMLHAPYPRISASPRRPPARCLLSSASYGTSRARFAIHLTTTPSSLRAGINLAPTKRGGLSVVGAGFTPTRIGC
jgi:hypothetical protein